MMRRWTVETTSETSCGCRYTATLESVSAADPSQLDDSGVSIDDLRLRVLIEGTQNQILLSPKNVFWPLSRYAACRKRTGEDPPSSSPIGPANHAMDNSVRSCDVTQISSTNLCLEGNMVACCVGSDRRWLESVVLDSDATHVWVRHIHDPTGRRMPVPRGCVRPTTPQVESVAQWFKDQEIIAKKVRITDEMVEWLSKTDRGRSFFQKSFWEQPEILCALVVEPDQTEEKSRIFLEVVGFKSYVLSIYGNIVDQIRSWMDVGWYQEKEKRRLKLLDERRIGQENSEKVEFLVHESLVGSVIGKQGENLSRVARSYKVEVRVFPDENGVRRVRLYGSDANKLRRAKAKLEYQYYEAALPPKAKNFVSWLCLEKACLKDIAGRHNLHSLWFDPDNYSIVICGLRSSVEEFLRALHIAYRDSLSNVGGVAGMTTTPLKASTGASTNGSSPPGSGGATMIDSGHAHLRSGSTSRSTTPLLPSPLTNSSTLPSRPPIMDALPVFKPNQNAVACGLVTASGTTSHRKSFTDTVSRSIDIESACGSSSHGTMAQETWAPHTAQQIGVVASRGCLTTECRTGPWWLTGNLPAAELIEKQNCPKERYEGFYPREHPHSPAQQPSPTPQSYGGSMENSARTTVISAEASAAPATHYQMWDQRRRPDYYGLPAQNYLGCYVPHRIWW